MDQHTCLPPLSKISCWNDILICLRARAPMVLVSCSLHPCWEICLFDPALDRLFGVPQPLMGGNFGPRRGRLVQIHLSGENCRDVGAALLQQQLRRRAKHSVGILSPAVMIALTLQTAANPLVGQYGGTMWRSRKSCHFFECIP